MRVWSSMGVAALLAACGGPQQQAAPYAALSPEQAFCPLRLIDDTRQLAAELYGEAWRTGHAPFCPQRIEAAARNLNESDLATETRDCQKLAASYAQKCGREHRPECAEQECVRLDAVYHLRDCAATPSTEWRKQLDERSRHTFGNLSSWDALREEALDAARCAGKPVSGDPSWQALVSYFQSLAAETARHVAPAAPPPRAQPLVLSPLFAGHPAIVQCACSLADSACSVEGFMASIECAPPYEPRERGESCPCEADDLLCLKRCDETG